MYAGFKKFARKKTDNLFGNDKKKAAGKAEHLNDKAPKNVVKHTDPPKGPVKNMEKPAPGKQKPTEINSKAPANASDTDVPNAPATKHTPEMKNTDPAPSNTNVEKLEKDIHPENSPVDKADAPKDQKVANGEKEPQSAVLNDDPNIEESNLKDLKKYEDDVDPSTKKKMKDKADGEVEKGPNHNSKTKALVMARIIAEANDKADTPVPVLMGELAALKAMKGVTGFGYKNGNAPGEFQILMYGSEYTVDPSYTPENSNENENPKKDDNFSLRPIEERETINDFRKNWPDSAITDDDIIYAKKNNLITAKETFPNANFLKLEHRIVDGRIIFEKKQKLPLSVEFVLTENGELALGKGHYFLSGEKHYVKGAGQVLIDEHGKIEIVNPHTGHYQTTNDELLAQAKHLRSLGITSDKLYITETPLNIEL